jgi:hypothetical protein
MAHIWDDLQTLVGILNVPVSPKMVNCAHLSVLVGWTNVASSQVHSQFLATYSTQVLEFLDVAPPTDHSRFLK